MASFTDDFNRADSNTVGNGWSEEEATTSDARILSNKVVFTTADAGVIHRIGQGWSDLIVTMTFELDSSTGDAGVAVKYNTGPRNVNSGSLCVTISTDGTTGTMKVFDNGTQKGSFTKALVSATQYKIEWIIFFDNSMEVRQWLATDARPGAADLTIAAFSVVSTGNRWAIGNRNGFRVDEVTFDYTATLLRPGAHPVPYIPKRKAQSFLHPFLYSDPFPRPPVEAATEFDIAVNQEMIY